MTSNGPDRAERHATGWHMDAPAAAQLLNRARTAPAEKRDDAVDWAFAAMPDHKHPRLLKIRQLLNAGDCQAADALLTQGLLQRPTDPSLVLLRAESLLIQGKARTANREARLVLNRRPEHIATLLLAARIASAMHDQPRAVELLRQASALRPWRDEIKELLTRALIEAGNIEGAARTLNQMQSPSILLRAFVLRAEGRLLEAIELLERSQRDASGDEETPELACELIDLLERIGDVPRLRRLLDEVGPDQPVILLRAGRSWLLLGAFQRAMKRTAAICRPGPHQRDALAVLLVAASMVGRSRLAERALERLQETPGGADPAVMADLWRRALSARLQADQRHGRRAGADRNAGLLQPLLHAAVEVLEVEKAARSKKSLPSRTAELERHLGLCLNTLGRTATPDEAVPTTATPEPAAPPIRKAA